MATTHQQPHQQIHPRFSYSASKMPGKSYVVQHDGTVWQNVAVADNSVLGQRIATLLSLAARLGWATENSEYLAQSIEGSDGDEEVRAWLASCPIPQWAQQTLQKGPTSADR